MVTEKSTQSHDSHVSRTLWHFTMFAATTRPTLAVAIAAKIATVDERPHVQLLFSTFPLTPCSCVATSHRNVSVSTLLSECWTFQLFIDASLGRKRRLVRCLEQCQAQHPGQV